MMKKLFLLILLNLIAASDAFAQWKVGFNFRDTEPYCTDGTDHISVIRDAYPTTDTTVTTGLSVTYGWVDALSVGDGSRDRDAAGDVRLCGINQTVNSGVTKRFQVDLPNAGTFRTCFALGDHVSQGYLNIEVLDNTSSIYTVTDTDGTAGSPPLFDDTAGTGFTAVAWPAGNVCRDDVFATSTLIFKLGATSAQTDNSSIAHFYVEEIGGGGGGGILGTPTNFSGGMQ